MSGRGAVPAAPARPAASTGVDLLGALAGGALYSLACIWPVLWPLQLVCLAALAAAAARRRPARAALLGLGFGSGWLAAGTWWIYISLHVYGGLPAPLAVAAVAALSIGLALYLALALALWAASWPGLRSPWAAATSWAALWLGAELARGVIFTGFPWLATGYGQIDGPLAGYAPGVGVYGIGAVAAALSAGVVLSLWPVARGTAGAHAPIGDAGRGRIGARLASALVPALVLLGAGVAPLGGHSDSRGRVAVSLLQTNVPQDEKFAAAALPDTLDRLAADLRGARGTLVVAPETAIPLLPDELARVTTPDGGRGWWAGLRDDLRAAGRHVLIGRPLGSYDEGYTNSVVGLAPGRPDYRYDKHHLVPFGEFIPWGFRWFTELMQIPLGDFNRGPRTAPSFEVGSQRVAPNICYEDLFGEELGARFADPATAPTVLANVSNIAWFGDSIAVPQHLQISRMRAIEFERPMLRATNTGATAVIDHRGRVQALLPPFTHGVLEAEVEGRDGLTPYARWVSALGLAPLWAVAGLGVLDALLRRRRTAAGGAA